MAPVQLGEDWILVKGRKFRRRRAGGGAGEHGAEQPLGWRRAKLWSPISVAKAAARLQKASPLAKDSLATKEVESKDDIRRVLGRK